MPVSVLILEDNPVARSFLCRVVRESFSDELEIMEASDLLSARQAIEERASSASGTGRKGAFDLYVLDLQLLDGSEPNLLYELSAEPAFRVVSTLYSDDEHLFPALQCGADGYLLKEDRFEVLVEELQRIVRGQPPLSPAIARRLLSHFRSGSGDSGPMPFNGRSTALQSFQPSRPGALDAPPASSRLSARETEVLTYLSKGFTLKEIANLMGIKWLAVNDHIREIYRKLGASRKPEPTKA